MFLGQQLTTQFGPHISSRLACFDRVILTGYLPFWSDNDINGWVGGELRIRCKDFIPQRKVLSNQLVAFAPAQAQRADAPFRFVQGRCRKDQLIEQIDRARNSPPGLIAVLCCLESNRTVKLKHGQHRPYFQSEYIPQRTSYFYLHDPQFGRMFVRIQTWFPWRIQIDVNGHDWLAQKMSRTGMFFRRQDNAFLSLDDPRRAQHIADGFARLNCPKILDRFAAQFNPLRKHHWINGRTDTWVIDQVEYSTDLLFTDRSPLTDLYPRLLEHAVQTFQAPDVMKFLGRRLTPQYQGEVQDHLVRERIPGCRIKHRVGANWIKTYDKFGTLLRVETVINSPQGDRVQQVHDQGQVQWKALGKNVKHFPRDQEIAPAANLRSLDAWAAVPVSHAASYRQVKELTGSRRPAGRSSAGFHVAKQDDIELFPAILAGEHPLRGFCTRDLWQRLHQPTSARHRRRQSQAISRRLKRLHIRGLIAKIPRTRRWKLTAQGATLLASVVRLYYTGLATAA